MSLPRLSDAEPHRRPPPARLPPSLQRALKAANVGTDPGWAADASGERIDYTPIASIGLLSFISLTVAIIALVVAALAGRVEGGRLPPLVLATNGRDLIDCVSDTMRIFVPQDSSSGKPPAIRLSSGGVFRVVTPATVQGGYSINLPVWQGEIRLPAAAAIIPVRPGNELIVRVDGYAGPELVGVRGRVTPFSNGVEVCSTRMDDPTSR